MAQEFRRDATAHTFVTRTIEERLQARETRAAFHAEATARLSRMEKTGKGIPAGEVFDYLRKRIQGQAAIRPRPQKIT